MGVEVTIIPHVVRCKSTGKDVKFDQYQIRIGQRVVGYLGKKPGLHPKLVVGSLSEECLNAINAAAAKVHGGEELKVTATVAHPIGAEHVEPPVPPADPADSAELEAALEAEDDKKE